jgi:hypothetical protein
MPVDALWNALNDPSHFATSQSTIEAILYCVRSRGLAALEEPDNKERVARCDEAAMKQIHDRIKKMREKGIVK